MDDSSNKKNINFKDRVTIYEVAKVAGVSLATISRVINNKNNVTEKTKAKVNEVINRLGYRPSAVAQSLANSKSTTIGIMIPSTGYVYVSNMLDGMIDTAKIYGYITSIFVTKRTKEDASNMIDLLIKSQVDGAVIYDDELGTDEIMTLQKYHIPLIVIGHEMQSDSLGSIVIQYKEPVMEVVKEYFDAGNDTICILDIVNQGKLMDEIKEEVISYAKEHNKKVELLQFNDSYSLVYAGMKEYFQTHKKGFFLAPRDSLAAAISNAALEANLKIPDDIQILAEVGSKYSYIMRPQISSFSIDMFKVGSIATRMLTKILNEPETMKEKCLKIRAKYNKRDTTK